MVYIKYLLCYIEKCFYKYTILSAFICCICFACNWKNTYKNNAKILFIFYNPLTLRSDRIRLKKETRVLTCWILLQVHEFIHMLVEDTANRSKCMATVLGCSHTESEP